MPKKSVLLRWTEPQLRIAELYEAGVSFESITAEGYSSGLVSKVINAIKEGQKPPGVGLVEITNNKTVNPDVKSVNHPPAKKEQKPGVATAPVTVGKITITPENWGFTQYGAILVLDTYNKAKRDLGYGGNIGDFLCDMCDLYRRIMNYKEVEYVRAAGEGGGGGEEDGGENPESVLQSG